MRLVAQGLSALMNGAVYVFAFGAYFRNYRGWSINRAMWTGFAIGVPLGYGVWLLSQL